jgi:hypothetical protein
MEVKAGATMELLTGEMKVNDEITNVAAHLRPELQFLGFVGSSKYRQPSNDNKIEVAGLRTWSIPRDEIGVLLFRPALLELCWSLIAEISFIYHTISQF